MIYSDTYMMLFEDYAKAKEFAVEEREKGNFGLLDLTPEEALLLSVEDQLGIERNESGGFRNYVAKPQAPPVLEPESFDQCYGPGFSLPPHVGPPGFKELCEYFNSEAAKLDWKVCYEAED